MFLKVTKVLVTVTRFCQKFSSGILPSQYVCLCVRKIGGRQLWGSRVYRFGGCLCSHLFLMSQLICSEYLPGPWSETEHGNWNWFCVTYIQSNYNYTLRWKCCSCSRMWLFVVAWRTLGYCGQLDLVTFWILLASHVWDGNRRKGFHFSPFLLIKHHTLVTLCFMECCVLWWVFKEEMEVFPKDYPKELIVYYKELIVLTWNCSFICIAFLQGVLFPEGRETWRLEVITVKM